MKFKDKDGNVFEDVSQALGAAFQCNECKGWENCALGYEMMCDQTCIEYATQNPAEAARLMGYEVVEDEPAAASAMNAAEYPGNHRTLLFNFKEAIQNAVAGAIKEAMADTPTESANTPIDTSTEEVHMNNKSLKDWTLEEVQEYCAARNGNCADDCALSNTGIGLVCKVTLKPVGWNLTERPHWTEQEVHTARTIAKMFAGPSGELKFYQDEEGRQHMISANNKVDILLLDKLFPSLNPGETVALKDIIGDADG